MMPKSVNDCLTMLMDRYKITKEEAQEKLSKLTDVRDFHGAGLTWEEITGELKRFTERQKAEVVRESELVRYNLTLQNVSKKNSLKRALQNLSALDEIGGGAYMKFIGDNFTEAVLSYGVGGTKSISWARDSVSALRTAYERRWVKNLRAYLREFPPMNKLLGAAPWDKARREEAKLFNAEVVRELHTPGTIKDDAGMAKEIRAMAALMDQTNKDVLAAMQAVGLDVRPFEKHGWMGRQKHDRARILAAGREEWMNFTRELVDWRRMPEFRYLKGKALEKAKASYLSSVYDNITKGSPVDVGASLNPLEPPKPGGVGHKHEHHRVLHFKDADNFLLYHDQFGAGDLMSNHLEHIQSAARTVSVREKFGPNPAATLEYLKEEFLKKAREMKFVETKAGRAALEKLEGKITGLMESGRADTPEGQAALAKYGQEIAALQARDFGSSKAGQRAISRLEAQDMAGGRGLWANMLAELKGDTMRPESVSIAKFWSVARALTSINKLGAAVLSAISDLPIVQRAFMKHGQGFFEAWGSTLNAFFGSIPPELRKETFYLCDAFNDGMLGQIATRLDVGEMGSGRMAGALHRFFKWTGLNWWTDNLKAGFAHMASAQMGLKSKLRFNELDDVYRDLLSSHNIGPEKWEAIRGHMVKEVNGKIYALPDLAAHVPDQVIDDLARAEIRRLKFAKGHKRARPPLEAIEKIRRETRKDLENTLMAFYADEVNGAVLNPDDRTRLFMYRGAAPGSIPGEALRLAMQFKSFGVVYTQRVLIPTLFGRPGQGLGRRGADLALLLAQTTAFGYLSMELKRLSRGQKPLVASDEELNSGQLGKAFTASFLQGGGAGIFGDFLFGEANRTGGGTALETLMGPVLSGPVNDAVNLWNLAREGEMSSAHALRTVWNNLPVNVWYARAALEYGILFRLQEMVNPGHLRKMERRMKKETGREYIVPPSEIY